MKVAFIIVLFKTPQSEIVRLKKEIQAIGLPNYKLYFIDNTEKNRGYAAGVNEGVKEGLKDGCDVFANANPDISLRGVKAHQIQSGLSHFDILGFAMRQDEVLYFGGEIDTLRMSGGLSRKKPKKQYVNVDFVSGSLTFVKEKVVNVVGLRDEDYFAYYEDVDYCYRAKKAGFAVGIDSSVIYEHFEESKKNMHKSEELSKSRLHFLFKHGSLIQKTYELFRLPKTILEHYGVIKNEGVSKPFFTNFLSLNISSLISKILNFVLFLFLIRYLSPQEYGLYALVWAQITLFSPLVDFGTTAYGVVHLPQQKKEVFLSLHNLRLTISIIIFFLTIFAGFFMFRGKSDIVSYIFLLSFVIFSNMFSGSYLIKNAVENRLYNSSIVSSMFNFVLIFSLVVSLVYWKSLSVVFIVIFIFYNLYSLLNYLLLQKSIGKFEYFFDLNTWIQLLKRSYIFILIAFFAGIYFKIDVFLLQRIKGEQAVGIYSAGYKFFEAMMFIVSSYNISRTPIFAKLVKKRKEELLHSMKKDIVVLGGSGFILALFFFFFAPIMLPLFLKGSYQSSVIVAQLVIFALPLVLISSVFLNALYVLNKAYVVLLMFIFQAVISTVLNYFFIPSYSYMASSFITIFCEIINMTILMLVFIKIYKKRYENIS